MRRLIAIVLVVSACGGSTAGTTTLASASGFDEAAGVYAASALRAIEGTAFEVLGARELTDLIVGLCEGLGVGAMGVAAADTGIDASAEDVAIFIEVLRTGLDQVCEQQVVVDLTSIYLTTISNAVTEADAGAAYDEITAIRAAPLVCARLEAGDGGTGALLTVVEVLYGIDAVSIDELAIEPDQGLVVGAVLATATALLCPDRLGEIESVVGGL